MTVPRCSSRRLKMSVYPIHSDDCSRCHRLPQSRGILPAIAISLEQINEVL